MSTKYGFLDFSFHVSLICNSEVFNSFLSFFLSFSTFCLKHPCSRWCSHFYTVWPSEGASPLPKLTRGAANAGLGRIFLTICIWNCKRFFFPLRLIRCSFTCRSIYMGVKPAGSTNSCAETIKPAPSGFWECKIIPAHKRDSGFFENSWVT